MELGVETPQLLGEHVDTLLAKSLGESLAQTGIALRHIVHTLAQRLDIQPRSSHGDYRVVSDEKAVEQLRGRSLVRSAIEILGQFVSGYEVVAHATQLLGIGMRRTDRKVAVYLTRIGRNHRRAEMLGHRHGEVGLARTRRADYDYQCLAGHYQYSSS